jgi:hypothetical protein
MKKIIKHRIANIIMVIMFTMVPFTDFAADKWSETPDLNNDSEIVSMITRWATFNQKNPVIDIWAETPDLNTGNRAHVVEIDNSYIESIFNLEMYVETPELR